MRRLPLLPCLLLVGCLASDHSSSEWDQDGAWKPVPCDPTKSSRIANNAPLHGSFRGSIDDVAAKLAKAMGETLTSASTSEKTASKSATDSETEVGVTERGRFTATRATDRYLLYESGVPWDSRLGTPGEVMGRFLRSLGLDVASLSIYDSSREGGGEVEVLASQRLSSGELLFQPLLEARFWEPALASGEARQIHVRPAYDLPSKARLSDERLTAIAKDYGVCATGEVPGNVWLDTRYARVRHSTLVWVVTLGSSEGADCGVADVVYLDGETGAVVEHETTPAACPV